MFDERKPHNCLYHWRGHDEEKEVWFCEQRNLDKEVARARELRTKEGNDELSSEA